MASVDVTVRGAGIFGLSIAWACLRRGAKVRVIETAHPGAGSSGGPVGALSPHVPEAWNAKKAFQLDSLLLAADWWTEVDSASGLSSGYARLGRLQPLSDDRAVAAARRRADEAQVLWQGRAEWRVIPAAGADWEPVSPSGWLVQDTLSARLSPRLALAALLGALTAGGAQLGGAEDGRVIHATGVSGLVQLSQALGLPGGSGVRGQALVRRFDGRHAPRSLGGRQRDGPAEPDDRAQVIERLETVNLADVLQPAVNPRALIVQRDGERAHRRQVEFQ